MGGQKQLTTADKALQVNLDPSRHGTVAAIGAEQEIVRWFFKVGGVDGLIAKSSPSLLAAGRCASWCSGDERRPIGMVQRLFEYSAVRLRF